MNKTFTVAEMLCRDLARRRGALGLLALVPLAFYLVRHNENPEKAIRFAALGLAWAVSTAGLFTANGTKAVEARLRMAGYRTYHLYLGTLAALLTVGLILSTAYFTLVYLDQDLQRPAGVALEFALTVLVAGPLGLVISAAAPRDLEGTLILITLTGLQFLVDPEKSLARWLPFWSSRELGIYAVEQGSADHLRQGLIHGLLFFTILICATAGLSMVRLRRRPHLQVVEGALV